MTSLWLALHIGGLTVAALAEIAQRLGFGRSRQTQPDPLPWAEEID